MIKHFKSALDKIKTEDELMKKTEEKLRDALLKQRNGEAVYFKKRSAFNMKKIAIVACAVIFLCSLAVGGYAYCKTPVAYLSIDINPSIELGINAFNNVVSATAYNGDGEAVLEGQDIINTSVEDAVNKIIDSADEKGFIEDDGSTIISITSETNDPDVAAKLESEAQKGAEGAIESNGSSAVIYKGNIALARRDEARKLGITPGKLNLIQKLQALDPTITVDQYKDAKVKDIMKKVYDLKKTAKTSDSQNVGTNSDNTSVDNKEADDLQNIEKAVEQSEKNKEQEKNKGTNVNKEQNREREQNQEQGSKIEVPASSKAVEPAKINADENQQKNGDDKQNYVPVSKQDDKDNNENKSTDTTQNNGSSNGKARSFNSSNSEGRSNIDNGKQNKK